MQLAQKVMDIVVPSAHAADLTAEDASPEIRFDDTNDEDYTPSYDWIIRAEGGTSDADTGNYFIISGYGETTGIGDVPIIRIDHDGDNSASSPIRALELTNTAIFPWRMARFTLINLGLGLASERIYRIMN